MTVGEKLLELMPVNIYKLVHEAKKAKLLELMQGPDKHYNDEIRSLMRERQLRYPEHYDSRD
ncbi:hypothetical protein KY285_030225 [Solanum tuberosum]|nr:hypothetical protein KY285_030225 [Solanum tuberosum]